MGKLSRHRVILIFAVFLVDLKNIKSKSTFQGFVSTVENSSAL